MEEATNSHDTTGPSKIPPEIVVQVRVLLHDLSNALEVVVQSQYLLSTIAGDRSGPYKEWLGLLERGAQQAIDVNRELREYVRIHS